MVPEPYSKFPLATDFTYGWRRQWHPTPVFLPGKHHGQRSLVGCSPWGRYKLDTAERLHFHFSLSCTGEGNGNPLQCSCLENPRDMGAWWAAVCGVAQSRTRLKRLSSSSSVSFHVIFSIHLTLSSPLPMPISLFSMSVSPSICVIFDFFHQCFTVFYI